MNPEATDYLLLPCGVAYKLAIADCLARNRPGSTVLVNDAVEKYATVASVDGEVVPLLWVSSTFVSPMSVIAHKAIFLRRPPAAFGTCFTE